MDKETKLLTVEQRQELGAELLRWRLRNNQRQEDVAQKLGYSRYTISRVERGSDRVDDVTAYKIYAYLVRQLRIEREAMTKSDEYIIDARANQDIEMFNDDLKKRAEEDWRLQLPL